MKRNDLKIFRKQKEIKDKYSLPNKVLITMDMLSGDITKLDNLYFFIYDNKKYIIKDKICINKKPEDYFEIYEIKPYDINILKEKIMHFIRTDMNKYSFLFPKFLEETDDFLILEYLEGDVVVSDYKSSLVYNDILDKLELFYSQYNGELCVETRIDYNWVKTQEGFKYFDMDSFLIGSKKFTLLLDNTNVQLSKNNIFYDNDHIRKSFIDKKILQKIRSISTKIKED